MTTQTRLATGLSTTIQRFIVNGRSVEVAVPGGRRLLDVLRLDLGLTGSKEGCGEGECGACSVLLDGQVVDSCLVPVCQVVGHDVRTVEDLARDERLDPLQAALLETGGVQCGFCTPGVLMASRAFLDSVDPDVPITDDAVREAIAGNLCRCTGYVRIVDAIRLAGERGDVPGRAPAADAPTPRTTGTFVDLGDPPAVTPHTLEEAYSLLAHGGWRPLAGGTDALVERAAGAADARGYLDLTSLDELRGVTLDGGALVLGAGTTYTELRRNPIVTEHMPVLAEVAARIGAIQIQNRGTIGGNIATASPAGDALPVLLALDAGIVLGSARGERIVPADAFFTAYRRTAREPDELVLRIRIPLVPRRCAVFRKVGARRAQAISLVAIAVAWRPAHDGTWRDVRVAFGAVAPTPIRARATEAVLEGALPKPEVAARAEESLVGEISPIDDVRSSAGYRRTVTGRMLRRIIRDAGGW